ncbi:MAG: hypothetical protein ACXAD7_19315, partial [Candidatus Kariarchaeaceae archaeon]
MGIEPIHLKSVELLLNLNFITKDESENWTLSPIMVETLNIQEVHLKSVEFLLNLNFVEKDRSENWILSPVLRGTMWLLLTCLAVKCVSTISATDYLKELISPMEL